MSDLAIEWADPTRPDGRVDPEPASWTRPSAQLAPACAASPTLAPGMQLAGTPYLVVRRLGHGGMGEVYEVEHADLGRRAALKVLHRHHHDRPDLAARLRDEARISARVRHPNLVEVFDLGVTADGRPYFAMPLLRGRDLRDLLLRDGVLPAATAITLCAQALDGLGAAHAAGLVHRDVKLENLFVEEGGHLKVLDFGVAKIAGDGGFSRTEPGSSPGTPRSMAPEQCAGRPVDARADLYAMGLALYEMVTGRGPFDHLSRDANALRYAHCERAPIPPSRLSPAVGPALEALILRALAKAPEDRFQTAAEMAAALRSLLPAPRAAPRAPVSRPRAGRLRRRAAPRGWMAAASVLAVAFFALGMAFGRTLPVHGAPDRAPGAAAAARL
jgi:serine/threonine protein kinase